MFPPTFYVVLALAGALLALSGSRVFHFSDLAHSSFFINKILHSLATTNTQTPAASVAHYDADPGYQVQIFSRDPLIIYIRNFVRSDEIAHLLDIRYVSPHLYKRTSCWYHIAR